MKTLHLTNAYHPTSGGIRHFYDALLRAAADAGCDVRLVVPGDRTSVEEVNSHARIYRVRSPRSAIFDRRYRLIPPSRALLPRGDVASILREESPDLVEICDKYFLCYVAGLIRKGWMPGVCRPVLVGLSCERMDDSVRSYLGLGRLGQVVSSAYMRRVYVPQFDCHLANSRYTAQELGRQARRHPRVVQVLPMGVEVDRFGPERRTPEARRALIARLAGSPDSRVLVYAGRLSPEKNLDLLPRMVRLLTADAEDYRLVIAGDGPMRDRLAAACQRLAPGRTSFWSHLDRETLAVLLANADAFVHPNAREPFGIGPLEALASGLPLVAPDAGGVTTYATAETSWPAPADPASFAARVRQIFSDPDDRQRRVSRALASSQTYRWEAVARQFFTTYEQLIRGFTGAPFVDASSLGTLESQQRTATHASTSSASRPSTNDAAPRARQSRKREHGIPRRRSLVAEESPHLTSE